MLLCSQGIFLATGHPFRRRGGFFRTWQDKTAGTFFTTSDGRAQGRWLRAIRDERSRRNLASSVERRRVTKLLGPTAQYGSNFVDFCVQLGDAIHLPRAGAWLGIAGHLLIDTAMNFVFSVVHTWIVMMMDVSFSVAFTVMDVVFVGVALCENLATNRSKSRRSPQTTLLTLAVAFAWMCTDAVATSTIPVMCWALISVVGGLLKMWWGFHFDLRVCGLLSANFWLSAAWLASPGNLHWTVGCFLVVSSNPTAWLLFPDEMDVEDKRYPVPHSVTAVTMQCSLARSRSRALARSLALSLSLALALSRPRPLALKAQKRNVTFFSHSRPIATV
jgi:hypothetical protein